MFFIKKKRTILIVESYKDRVERLENILQSSNFQTLVARNGNQTKQLTLENNCDLILLAVNSLDINSYELIAELRDRAQTLTTPIVMLSDRTNTVEWRKAIEAGADDYLGHPFTAIELGRAIAVQLQKKIAQEEKIQYELEQLRLKIAEALPHELKTVLTGILTSSELLYSDLEKLDSSTVRQIINCIRLSGHRLSRLSQNSLLYAELEMIYSNPQELEKLRSSYTNSSASILECVATRCAQNVEREADLKLELQNASVQIESNHFFKLVEEIVDNALKFSEPNTIVRIKSKKNKNYLVLSVSNRGKGMSSQQIDRIGAYMQFDRHHEEQQGVGLGLAIAQRLVNLYGGKLAIESIPNRETKIEVSLPLADLYLGADNNPSRQFEVA